MPLGFWCGQWEVIVPFVETGSTEERQRGRLDGEGGEGGQDIGTSWEQELSGRALMRTSASLRLALLPTCPDSPLGGAHRGAASAGTQEGGASGVGLAVQGPP